MKSSSDQEIPDRLPMLDAYLDHTHGKAQPLENTTAVLIQHQLGSQVPMTKALIRLGLSPKKIYWVDIPYTANEKVKSALLALGIPARNFSSSNYHVGKAYAPYQRTRIQKLLILLQNKLSSRDRLLVLDDGSYFLEALACHALPKFKISIVEQTTRGIIKLKNDATLQHYSKKIPIVNVAESRPKKELESPFIGEAVCESLVNLLKGKGEIGKKNRCLILGYGAIGQNVARSLSRAFGLSPKNIQISEPQKINQKKAIQNKHTLWDRKNTDARFNLVVGCSGTISFTLGDRIYLEDGAYLASASSGASELSREEFIDLADSFPDDHIYVKNREALHKRPIRETIEIRLVDRDVHFLNGGFPVNFTGAVNCVSPKYIQTTHTLQVGGAVQALSEKRSGLLDLDRSLCRFVQKKFNEMMANE
jgi:hypothetical protein